MAVYLFAQTLRHALASFFLRKPERWGFVVRPRELASDFPLFWCVSEKTKVWRLCANVLESPSKIWWHDPPVLAPTLGKMGDRPEKQHHDGSLEPTMYSEKNAW